MTSSSENSATIVHKCEVCGKLEVRGKPRADAVCPECGAKGFRQVQLVGGAIGYTVADRRHGPSIEDGRLGRMAYFADWMTFEQIARCLETQKESVEEGEPAPRFGEVAVQEDFLTEPQVLALLRMQVIHTGPARHDLSLGALAVREGFVSQEQLDEALRLQKNLLKKYLEAPLLGIILVESKLLSSRQVKQLLDIQAQHGIGPLAKLREAIPAGAVSPPEAEIETLGPPEGPEETEAAASAAELTVDRILCRCSDCGWTGMREAWKSEDTCPECDSSEFVPVPILGDKAAEGLTEEGPGPAIEDGRFGRLAYFAGWMTSEQVGTCLELQQKAVKDGRAMPRFGQLAIREGYLSEAEVSALARMQGLHRPIEYDRTFGALAVRNGFITQEQLDDCLAEQKRSLRESNEAPSLGLLMCESGLLTDQQVKAILTAQAKLGQGILPQLEIERAEASSQFVKKFFKAAKGNKAWVAALSVAVLLFSGVALGTGWFGAYGWRPPAIVVGCRSCGVALEAQSDGPRDCPKCAKRNGLGPLVRCAKCGHTYLYGPYGAGTWCRKCRFDGVVPVENVDAARKLWAPRVEREPVAEDEDSEAEGEE